jgi:purine-binding chemotaxis protein CheW
MAMDHEYDDDRPTDRPGELDNEFAFEAPDLATAFLEALDAVDDRRFVTPPLDDLLSDELIAAEPGPEPAAAEPPAPVASATPPEEIPFETPSTMMIDARTLEPQTLAAETLEAGTLELTAVDAYGAVVEPPTHYGADASSAETSAEAPADDYVIEHDDPPPAPVSAAVAEAFAREQAALELWGSDEASAALDAAAEDVASSEFAESAEAIDSIESIEASQTPAVPSWSAAVNVDTPAELVAETPVAETPLAETLAAETLVAETVSNADSYYDPDTLRLTRPLFSPDEPRAFAAPVYVGETSDATEVEAGAESVADVESEVLEDLEEFVAFSLGDTRCVVPIRNVIEIGRIPAAVAVPNAPAWLHGLGNLRGQVLSLIDLRAFLGIGRVRPATGRMLVLRADDDEVQAGLLVDHVHQIVSLSASRFHPVPDTLARHYARHAWGVCDYGNFTMIGLEVDSLLGVENMVPLGEAAEVA